MHCMQCQGIGPKHSTRSTLVATASAMCAWVRGGLHITWLRAAGRVAQLTLLEQAFVLALATVEHRGGAHALDAGDWLLTPYVDALLMQPRTRHAVAVCTLLMRARHELRRVRVRERGLLTLQAMHDHLQARRHPPLQTTLRYLPVLPVLPTSLLPAHLRGIA